MRGSGTARKRALDAGPVERFFRFSVLGLVASGYLALAGTGHLDLVTTTVTGAAILVRLLLDAGLFRLPISERWITGLTLAYIVFYGVDYRYLSGEFLPATVHLVLFLAVMKILTARTDRDYLYVVVIAFLELLIASVLSSRLNYFVFLALFLLSAVATFSSWVIRRSLTDSETVARLSQPRIHWRLSVLAVLISLGILAITMGLFFFLPRTARAAFQHLAPERFHITAFSGEVRLGQIGELQRRSTVLMHVRIQDPAGLPCLRWRGTALAEFDGKRWYNTPAKTRKLPVLHGLLRLASDAQRRRAGRRLNYEVRLKSFASDVLFIAGRPEFIRIDSPVVFRTEWGGYRAGLPNSGIVRYGVLSFLDPPSTPRGIPVVRALSPEAKSLYLRLPAIDPRITDLARRVTAGYPTPAGKARAIENYLRSSYRYTLELPDTEAADPVAQFLFERGEGHCEYFASAMAVMLRGIGIPSRVVTGFAGGVYNPISGWYMIRASDAHSWVEAFLPQTGWTTFDPVPAGAATAAMTPWTRLSLLFDAADTFWREWVLDYDLNRQLVLAARVGKSGRGFSTGWFGGASVSWSRLKREGRAWFRQHGPAAGAVVVVLLLAVVIAGWGRRRWRERRRIRRARSGDIGASDATVLYSRALGLLRRRGMEKPAWLTPAEFLRLIPAPETAAVFGRLTVVYNGVRFGGRRDTAREMVSLVDELERVLKRS